LLEALCTDARARCATAIVLSTQPSMRAAHRLYSEAGFRRAPARDWKRPDGREYWALVKMHPAPPSSTVSSMR
jgi:ribosomal protein S18 acetylase RimI-like enzyme